MSLLLKSLPLKISTLFFTGCIHSLAQQAPADSSRINLLDQIVVTATRSESRKENVAQKIDLISPEDILMTPAQDLTDIVRKVAAVDVIQYPNLSSGIGIRGFRPQFSGLNQRTLLLIDGRPAGATNLSQISLNGIERIEVMKGPASSLYGSQAMGGVINVITKRSKGPSAGNVFLEYGSFKTVQAGLNTGGNLTKRIDYDLSFNYLERSKDYKIGYDNWLRKAFGFTAAQKNYVNRPFEQVDETGADGDRRPFTELHYYSGAMRLGYQFNKNWRLDLRGESFEAKNVESPGEISSGSTEASTKDVGRSALDMSLSGHLGAHTPTVKIFIAEEGTSNYTMNVAGKPIVPFRSAAGKNEWKGIQIKDVWKIGQHSLIVGYDLLQSGTSSQRWVNDSTRRAPTQPAYNLKSSALYVQGLLNFGRIKIQPGLRYDNITFDVRETALLPAYRPGKEKIPFTSPSLGITYNPLRFVYLKANAGRAFVTTDAYSVAGYNEVRDSRGRIAVTSGNPELKNESSLSWDFGILFSRPESGLSVGLTYFSTQVENRIAKIIRTVNDPRSNGDVVTSRATFVNAAEAEINGVEAELSYDFGVLINFRYSLKTFLNGTSMINAKEAIVASDASETTRRIQNVARNTFNYGIEYDNLKWLKIRLSGRSVGNRTDIDYTDPINPEIEYPSYMVMDLAAVFSVSTSHSLTLKVANLTDENYYEKRGYNLPGRAISCRYTFRF